MSETGRNPEELLLDWHLHRLEGDDRSDFESRLHGDPHLQEQNRRLGEILRPLDHWSVPSPPARFAERILEHVQMRRAAAQAPSFAEAPAYRPARRMPLREMIAIAACVGALAGLAVPGLGMMRERSRQIACAGNLNGIFQGTSLYQAAFTDSLPYAGAAPGRSWLATTANGNGYASNSRHIFLLARLGLSKAENFICPSKTNARAMSPTRLAQQTDFPSACSISYDSLNLAGDQPNLRPRSAIAYVSDANPLFIGGRFHESVDPQVTNSPTHKGKAQSVLTLDGSVARQDSPIYGAHRDNLWLAGDIRRYTGLETPVDDFDAFLVPGCLQGAGGD